MLTPSISRPPWPQQLITDVLPGQNRGWQPCLVCAEALIRVDGGV